MPDFADYDEATYSNTLQSTCHFAAAKLGGIQLPNLQQLGFANILKLKSFPAIDRPLGSYGKMAEQNKAKDTITGHWEMMGIKALKPFPYYPKGFPEEILNAFKQKAQVAGILANKAASGTEIINELGDEHLRTKYPIIYTSADSVLQIAAHLDAVPLETLYHWCEIAREIMRGPHEVARIIARPFTTNKNPNEPGKKYVRVGDKRHDYSILPHGHSVLESVLANQGEVIGFGKIYDIFAGVGVSHNIHTKDNTDGLEQFIKVLGDERNKHDKQVLFINLVETDSNFGHRRDAEGFARALEYIDKQFPRIINALSDEDLLFVTADHGCDPCAPGTDHTREYVPILCYNRKLTPKDLGTRTSFADIGASILDWFNIKDPKLAIAGSSLIS
jgi:phosphopentomutase